MGRRWRQAICTVLLGMAVLTSALWVLSYRQSSSNRLAAGFCFDTADASREGSHIIFSRGLLSCWIRRDESMELPFRRQTSRIMWRTTYLRFQVLPDPAGPITRCSHCEFAIAAKKPGRRVVVHVVMVPFVMLVAMFAAVPVLMVGRAAWRRWSPRNSTACSHCGYDLTGNESGVCPECGNAAGTG